MRSNIGEIGVRWPLVADSLPAGTKCVRYFIKNDGHSYQPL